MTGIPPGLLLTMAGISLVVFLGTLIAIPFILAKLPEDYFDLRVPRQWMKDSHPALRMIGKVVKNVVGLFFFLAGVSMLVLPGQGVLTMLIGLSLLDFPGRRRIEARIVGHPKVFSVVNNLRARMGKPPFVLAPR